MVSSSSVDMSFSGLNDETLFSVAFVSRKNNPAIDIAIITNAMKLANTQIQIFI